MPVIGLLIIGVQVFFAIHAIRSGRSNWLWVLLVFPGVGSLIYFFAEYLPSLQRGNSISSTVDKISTTINPTKAVIKLKEQVELNDCLNNRLLLGEAYSAAKMYNEAIELYVESMNGPYEKDPSLFSGLAKAHFLNKNYEKVIEVIETFIDISHDRLSKDIELLYARAYEESGLIEKASDLYKNMINKIAGEEVRCRLALLELNRGNTYEAKNYFQEILRNVRLSPSYYKRSEKKWVGIAKSNLYKIP